MTFRDYAWGLAIALDRLAHAVGGGDGRLTISGACWRGECAGDARAARWRRRIDAAALRLFGQVDHCKSSDAYDTALVAWTIGTALANSPVILPA